MVSSRIGHNPEKFVYESDILHSFKVGQGLSSFCLSSLYKSHLK